MCCDEECAVHDADREIAAQAHAQVLCPDPRQSPKRIIACTLDSFLIMGLGGGLLCPNAKRPRSYHSSGATITVHDVVLGRICAHFILLNWRVLENK